jgi:NTE family protein
LSFVVPGVSQSYTSNHNPVTAVKPHPNPSTFTLVLGGGGARGLAHIGVLKALEREGLVPAFLVGTSMGAIVGGMYAQRPDARLVEDRMRELLQSKSFRKIGLDAFAHDGAPDGLSTVSNLYGRMKRGYGLLKSTWSTGIVEAPTLLEFLGRLLDDRSIEECAIPFASVACDLMTGQEVVCQTGSILLAVATSSAIPGVVTPINISGRLLVDGAPTSIVPVHAAQRLSPFPVVAVSVTQDVREGKPIANAIDVVLRAGAIARMQLSESNLGSADVVLRPRVESYGWADFDSHVELIAEGERAVENALHEIVFASRVRRRSQTRRTLSEPEMRGRRTGRAARSGHDRHHRPR